MKLFQKSIITLLVSTAVLSGADKFVALPIFNDNSYKANIEVALVGGSISFTEDESAENGMIYGVEASLDCPVFTLPGDNPLRQQFSVNRYSDTGIDITTIEVNPYYFISLTQDMVFGFGPGFGAAKVDIDGFDSEWLFTYQAGAGVKYYIDNFLVGIDARYQGTTGEKFGTTQEVTFDNTRFMAKVGYRF